jgi:hypothetical protein
VEVENVHESSRSLILSGIDFCCMRVCMMVGKVRCQEEEVESERVRKVFIFNSHRS